MVALVVGRQTPPGLPPLPPAGAKPRASVTLASHRTKSAESSAAMSSPEEESDLENSIYSQLRSWDHLRTEVSRQIAQMSGTTAPDTVIPLANGRLPSPGAKPPRSTTGLLVRPSVEGAGGSVTGCIPGSPAHLSRMLEFEDVVVEVEGKPFTDPEGFHHMRGQDLIGSQVKLLIKREEVGSFELTVVRDSFEAVKLKREIYALLDQIFQKFGDTDKENNPREASHSNGVVPLSNVDSKSVTRVYELMDELCSVNIAALHDLRHEVHTRGEQLQSICQLVLQTLDDREREMANVREALRGTYAASSSKIQSAENPEQLSADVVQPSLQSPDGADLAVRLLSLEDEFSAQCEETASALSQLREAQELLGERDGVILDLQTVLKSSRQKCADVEDALLESTKQLEAQQALSQHQNEELTSQMLHLREQLEDARAAVAHKNQYTSNDAFDADKAALQIAELRITVRELEGAVSASQALREEEHQRDLMLRARMKRDVCVRAIRRWINTQLLAIVVNWHGLSRMWHRQTALCNSVKRRREFCLLHKGFRRWDAASQNARRLWHAGVTAATRWIYRRASCAMQAWWTLVFRVLDGEGAESAAPSRRAIQFAATVVEDGRAVKADLPVVKAAIKVEGTDVGIQASEANQREIPDTETAKEFAVQLGQMAARAAEAEHKCISAEEERAALVTAMDRDRSLKEGEIRALQLAQAALLRTMAADRQAKDGEIRVLRAEICSLANYIRVAQRDEQKRQQLESHVRGRSAFGSAVMGTSVMGTSVSVDSIGDHGAAVGGIHAAAGRVHLDARAELTPAESRVCVTPRASATPPLNIRENFDASMGRCKPAIHPPGPSTIDKSSATPKAHLLGFHAVGAGGGRKSESEMDITRDGLGEMIAARLRRRREMINAFRPWAVTCAHRRRQMRGVLRFFSRGFARVARRVLNAWRGSTRQARELERLVDLAAAAGNSGRVLSDERRMLYALRALRLAVRCAQAERLRLDELTCMSNASMNGASRGGDAGLGGGNGEIGEVGSSRVGGRKYGCGFDETTLALATDTSSHRSCCCRLDSCSYGGDDGDTWGAGVVGDGRGGREGENEDSSCVPAAAAAAAASEALWFAKRRARRFQVRLRRAEEDVRSLHTRVRFLEGRVGPHDLVPAHCQEATAAVAAVAGLSPMAARLFGAGEDRGSAAGAGDVLTEISAGAGAAEGGVVLSAPVAPQRSGESRGSGTLERLKGRCAEYFFESGSLSLSTESTLSLSRSSLCLSSPLHGWKESLLHTPSRNSLPDADGDLPPPLSDPDRPPARLDFGRAAHFGTSREREFSIQASRGNERPSAGVASDQPRAARYGQLSRGTREEDLSSPSPSPSPPVVRPRYGEKHSGALVGRSQPAPLPPPPAHILAHAEVSDGMLVPAAAAVSDLAQHVKTAHVSVVHSPIPLPPSTAVEAMELCWPGASPTAARPPRLSGPAAARTGESDAASVLPSPRRPPAWGPFKMRFEA